MSEKLPEFLKQGEKARLIPITADSNKEARTLSVLLAMASAIPDLGHALFESVGQRIGKRAKIEVYTEVVPRHISPDVKDRPDGLAVIKVGKKVWSAFIEAKIGNSSLKSEQIERYLELAKTNGVDALITISNDFTARVDHHPVPVSKKLTKKVGLYHWPWMWVYTQTILLQMEQAVEDEDQAFLVDELVRFLGDPSTGIRSFDRMGTSWKDIVKTVQTGGALKKTDPKVEETVASWHEEERDLCLILSRQLGERVRLKIPHKHRNSPIERLKADCASLAETGQLVSTLKVPNAASDVQVVADLATRSVTVSMELAAPEDRKSTKARVNWVLRQISNADDPDIVIRTKWPSKVQDVTASLEAVRANLESVHTENPKLVPRAIEIALVRDIAGKFAGSRTFIEHVEEIVPTFYAQIGQHLRAWRPAPPKASKAPLVSENGTAGAGEDTEVTSGSEQPAA
jgi:hypothetical protein